MEPAGRSAARRCACGDRGRCAVPRETADLALEIARRFARIVAALRAAEDAPGPQARAIVALPAAELRAFAAAAEACARGEIGLAATMGLRPGQSERRSSTLSADEDRSAILREAAQRFFSGHVPAQRAGLLADELAKYERRAWLRDRASLTCPRRHSGRLEEALWRFLKAGGRALSVDRIREIVGASCPVSYRCKRSNGNGLETRGKHDGVD